MQSNRPRLQRLMTCALLALGLMLASCDRSDTPGGATPNDGVARAKVPAGLALTAPPEGARDVADLKATAKAGEEAVLRGIIGGRVKPFVEGRAVLTVVDATFPGGPCKTCESCPTPWDYCCAEQAELATVMATVQVADAAGKPLVGTLKGVAGLEPLATVVVRGTVADAQPGKVLLLNATGIYVEPKPAPAPPGAKKPGS